MPSSNILMIKSEIAVSHIHTESQIQNALQLIVDIAISRGLFFKWYDVPKRTHTHTHIGIFAIARLFEPNSHEWYSICSVRCDYQTWLSAPFSYLMQIASINDGKKNLIYIWKTICTRVWKKCKTLAPRQNHLIISLSGILVITQSEKQRHQQQQRIDNTTKTEKYL